MKFQKKTGTLVPCLPGRGFAHRWIIGSPDETGEQFKVGKCEYCKKDEVFRAAWPERLNYKILSDEHLNAETELLGEVNVL